jgi:hypothetical protein
MCSLTKNLKFLRASLHHTHELARIIFLVTYHVLRYFLDIQVRTFLHNTFLLYFLRVRNISKSDFAKMTGSLHQTHKKKFRIYAVYATAAPATLSLVLIILDNSLNETYFLYPNIVGCWFAGKTLFQKIDVLIKLIFFPEKSIEYMYLQGPIVLILVQNIAFFLITFYKIYKMKSESKVLKRGDSMTHNGETTNNSNRKRFKK